MPNQWLFSWLAPQDKIENGLCISLVLENAIYRVSISPLFIQFSPIWLLIRHPKHMSVRSLSLGWCESIFFQLRVFGRSHYEIIEFIYTISCSNSGSFPILRSNLGLVGNIFCRANCDYGQVRQQMYYKFNRFPVSLYNNMSRQHHNQLAQCSICLEKAADSSVNGCEHSFCLRCIRKWAKSKNTCPLCRKEFLEIRSLKRKYTVVPPPPPPPRRRIPSQLQHQRRIVYIPIILPQPLCYYYSPNSSILINGQIDLSTLGQHFAIPSFFIPN